MDISKLRSICGLIMLFSQILMLLQLSYFLLRDALFFDQFTTLVGVISPIFTVYIFAYLGSVVKNRTRKKLDRTVSKEFAFLTAGLSALLAVVLLSLVYLRGFGIVNISFEQLKGIIVTSEVLIGGMAGKLYFSAFD